MQYKQQKSRKGADWNDRLLIPRLVKMGVSKYNWKRNSWRYLQIQCFFPFLVRESIKGGEIGAFSQYYATETVTLF